MEGSTVYFTDFRCPVGTSLTEKLRRKAQAAPPVPCGGHQNH